MANVLFEKEAKKKSLLENKFKRRTIWVLHWNLLGIRNKEGRIKGITTVVESSDSSPSFIQIIKSENNAKGKLSDYFENFIFKLAGAELYSSFVIRVKRMNWIEKWTLVF